MARPASDVRERILISARERFLIDGVEGASLRAIARDAGTNIGMVYHYFPTKDDLFFAILESVYGPLVEELVEAMQGVADPVARLRVFYDRVARISDDEFAVVRMLMRENLVSSERRKRVFERAARGHLLLLAQAVMEGVGGGARRGDVAPTLLVVMTIVVGAIPQMVRRLVAESNAEAAHGFGTPEELAATLHDVLLHGIGGAVALASVPGEADGTTTRR